MKRFLCAYVFVLLVYLNPCYAQTLGYDFLGAAKQDIGMLAAQIEPGTAVGVLEGTFGKAIPPLETFLKTGKIIAFRAHLINGTCWRNHNCEKGEPRVDDLKTLGKRATAFEALHSRYPSVACFLSPVLEHDVKDKELVRKWVQVLRENAPSCSVVISAFTGFIPEGTLTEGHGNQASGALISNDGNSLYDADTSKYWKGGHLISFGWIDRFNLRYTGLKVWIPPSKRTAKATKDDMKQINALMKPVAPIPPAPKACKKVIKIQGPETLKSNSEDYAQGNPRDNKPVLLIKARYSNGFGILAPNGQKVGCAASYSPPLGNLNRYYVGICSNKSNTEILRQAGNEWVFYKNGGTCYEANAIRRLGTFR